MVPTFFCIIEGLCDRIQNLKLLKSNVAVSTLDLLSFSKYNREEFRTLYSHLTVGSVARQEI